MRRSLSISPFWTLFLGYLLLTLLNAGFGHLEHPDQRLKGNDPVYYYVYLHSLFFDGDLSFANNIEQFMGHVLIPETTVQGYHHNYFSIGPAILWSPFFFIAHGLALASPWFGMEWAADGWSYPYITAIYFGHSIYALLGCWFTYRFVATLTDERAALFAALMLMFASQMTFYVWPDNIMSHNASFAMAALFLWSWRRYGLGMIAGWAAAWMILSRWQNAILLLPMMVQALRAGAMALRDKTFANELRRHASFALTLLAGVAPQMIVWQVIYGTPVTVPQGEGFLRFDDLHLWSTLFSAQHGLFSWHPMLLVGLVGLVGLRKQHPWLVYPLLTVLGLQWILNAAVIDWWAGWSFGHRRFDSVLPLFALGLAAVHVQLRQTRWRTWLMAVALFFVAWNFVFIYQFKKALIPRDRFAPTWEQLIFEKFRIMTVREGGFHAFLAMERLKEDNIPEFIGHSLNAYEKAPNLGVALPMYGMARLLSKEYLEARVALEEWVVREPELFLARWALAELHVQLGNYDGASQIISPFLTVNPQAQLVAARVATRAPTLWDLEFRNGLQNYLLEVFYIY